MVSLFRFLLVSLVFTLGMTTAGFACQNPKILDYLSPTESEFKPVTGDINGDGNDDTIMLNLKGGWLVAEFYINKSSLKSCEPDVYLKYLNIKGDKDPKLNSDEWFPQIEITPKGSIIFTSQYYCNGCPNGGVPFVDYILTLRYLSKNSIQVIGYDDAPRNIQNGPSVKMSINLLTGKILGQLVGDFYSGMNVLDEKVIKYNFKKVEIPSGSVISVGDELRSLHDEVWDSFDRFQYYDDVTGKWKQ